MLDYYGCRRSIFFQKDITSIIYNNIDRFKVAYEYVLDSGLRLIFSHAGISYTWAKHLQYFLNEKNGIHKTADDLNKDFINSYDINLLNSLKENELLRSLLWHIGQQRGGEDLSGSCLWADIYEHINCESDYENLPEYKNIYQVFSHSYCTKPYITKKFAMLDCKDVFVIDCKDGKLMTYKEFDENINR